jgi:hypothetical protein
MGGRYIAQEPKPRAQSPELRGEEAYLRERTHMKLGSAAAIVVCLVAWSPTTARASTNDLLHQCEALEQGMKVSEGNMITIPNTNGAQVCWGYFEAIQDFARVNLNGEMLMHVCPPKDSTTLQFNHIFTQYAQAHPDQMAQPTERVVLAALLSAFGCH